MAREELLRELASLSAEERRALGLYAPTVGPEPQSHKWQALADAVPDVAAVVNACRAGVKHALEHPGDDGDLAGWQKLTDVNPTLAAAARASSMKRGKSLVWSLGRIADYLQSETAEQRRAAARRRVPTATPVADASAPSGKAGAK